MQRQDFLRRAAAAAVLVVTICVPAVRADDESPYVPPEARIGRPPGVTDTPISTDPQPAPSLPPGETPTTDGETASQTGIGSRLRGQAPVSFWEAVVAWLQEQALRVGTRGRG